MSDKKYCDNCGATHGIGENTLCDAGKKWHENIPKNGVLCRENTMGGVVRITGKSNLYQGNVMDGVSKRHFDIDDLTPLTAAEWWKFAPWQDMDSAPNNTPIFVRYDDGLVSIEIALNWAVRKNIVAWLPLLGDL